MNRSSARNPRAGPPLAARKSLRVVAIGGGTGLSTLLKGLKRYVAIRFPPKFPHIQTKD